MVGFGRFGQTVAQTLMAGGISVTLIDSDVEMIDVASDFGATVYFGDGMRIDLLRQAGAGNAQAILFCTDGDQVDLGFTHAVHAAFPQAAVYVRGFDRRSPLRLHDAPVENVTREVLESAMSMARLALDRLGLSLEEIDRAEAIYRTHDQDRLDRQIASGDLHAAREIILTKPEIQAERG